MGLGDQTQIVKLMISDDAVVVVETRSLCVVETRSLCVAQASPQGTEIICVLHHTQLD